MERIHKTVSRLPIFIVSYWLFCAVFLTKCSFYFKYFKLFDTIDTVIVSLSLMHFILFFTKYTKNELIYISCLASIICLSLCYENLKKEAYYFLYLLIVFCTLLASIWKKKS